MKKLIIIITLAILLLISMGYANNYLDNKNYNSGVCAECGNNFEFVCATRNGLFYYTCKECGHTSEIMY